MAITHGGVGTVFEALEAGCAVVGVDNPDLQEGHQAELLEALQAGLHEGVHILVKGSRRMRMEQVVEMLGASARSTSGETEARH